MTEEIPIDLSNQSLPVRIKEKVQNLVFSLLTKWQKLSKRQKLLLGSGVGTSFVLLTVSIFWLAGSSSPITKLTPTIKQGSKTDNLTVISPEEVKDQESPLDGVMVTADQMAIIKARRPLAVIIDNNIAARPAFGLNEADLVYEALVEGGITRLMAIYLRGEPQKVGPVRSLRTYFLDWIAELNDPLIMHVGYAPPAPQSDPRADVLAYIYRHDVKTLGVPATGNFWRASTRRSPHNAFSNTIALWETAKQKGWHTLQPLETWSFKSDAPPQERPETRLISLNWDGWGTTAYSVTWTYDKENNYYLREYNTQKDVDKLNDEQVWAKNIVIVLSVQTLAYDSLHHILYQTTGEGRAQIFLDGKVIDGYWRKNDRTSRTKFYDEQNKEVSFNRGRTWIMVAPERSEIKY